MVCSATLSNSDICWSLFNDDFLQFIPLLSKTEIFQVHDAKKPQKGCCSDNMSQMKVEKCMFEPIGLRFSRSLEKENVI